MRNPAVFDVWRTDVVHGCCYKDRARRGIGAASGTRDLSYELTPDPTA